MLCCARAVCRDAAAYGMLETRLLQIGGGAGCIGWEAVKNVENF